MNCPPTWRRRPRAAHLHHAYEGLRHGQALPSVVVATAFQVAYTSLFGSFATFIHLRTGNTAVIQCPHVSASLRQTAFSSAVRRPRTMFDRCILRPSKSLLIVSAKQCRLSSKQCRTGTAASGMQAASSTDCISPPQAGLCACQVPIVEACTRVSLAALLLPPVSSALSSVTSFVASRRLALSAGTLQLGRAPGIHRKCTCTLQFHGHARHYLLYTSRGSRGFYIKIGAIPRSQRCRMTLHESHPNVCTNNRLRRRCKAAGRQIVVFLSKRRSFMDLLCIAPESS